MNIRRTPDMRAKLALVLAAFGLMLTSSQASLASDVVNDVNNILYDYDSPGLLGGLLGGALGTTTNVLTQPAIVGGRASINCAAPLFGSNGTSLKILELPTVLAPAAACSTAIITKYPSDLDIRREDLARRLSAAGGACAMPAGSSLSAALAQVGAAEVQWRSDGLLDVRESRRLYKAMDRVGLELDSWRMDRPTGLLGGGFFGYH